MQSDQVSASILTKGQLYPVKHTKRGNGLKIKETAYDTKCEKYSACLSTRPRLPSWFRLKPEVREKTDGLDKTIFPEGRCQLRDTCLVCHLSHRIARRDVGSMVRPRLIGHDDRRHYYRHLCVCGGGVMSETVKISSCCLTFRFKELESVF